MQYNTNIIKNDLHFLIVYIITTYNETENKFLYIGEGK
jgi:hypothetical protein